MAQPPRLEDLPHGVLRMTKDKAKQSGDRRWINRVATAEHQAAARAATEDGLLGGFAVAAMAAPYSVVKATAMTSRTKLGAGSRLLLKKMGFPIEKGTSDASLNQVTAGFRGFAQGVSKRLGFKE